VSARGLERGRVTDELEAERKAIARELHDGPIQHLTAASLRLSSALSKGSLGGEAAGKVIADIDAAAAQLRALMSRLLAPEADG